MKHTIQYLHTRSCVESTYSKFFMRTLGIMQSVEMVTRDMILVIGCLQAWMFLRMMKVISIKEPK